MKFSMIIDGLNVTYKSRIAGRGFDQTVLETITVFTKDGCQVALTYGLGVELAVSCDGDSVIFFDAVDDAGPLFLKYTGLDLTRVFDLIDERERAFWDDPMTQAIGW